MEPWFPVDPTGAPLDQSFETYQSDIKFITPFSSLGMNNDPSNVMEGSIDVGFRFEAWYNRIITENVSALVQVILTQAVVIFSKKVLMDLLSHPAEMLNIFLVVKLDTVPISAVCTCIHAQYNQHENLGLTEKEAGYLSRPLVCVLFFG